MYRVRPEKKSSAEDVKRYPRRLKIRLQEKFLAGENHYFEEKLTADHLKRGVWICLEHFTGVDQESFMKKFSLPEDSALIKDNRKKCKTRIQVRVSALPILKKIQLKIKEESHQQNRAEQDDDLEIVFQAAEAVESQQEEVQVLYASESVEKNYKVNRRMYSQQNWDPLEKIESVSVHAIELFDHGVNCLPSVMDRFIESAGTDLVKILGASSVIFEASLRDDREINLQNYLQDLTYSCEAKYFFLPYYFYGSWSLLTYNITEMRADNYVLSSKYDWRVHHQLEKILFSVQDKLMLRRRGVLYKNTHTNISEVYDSSYKSAIKVMSVMRQIVLGRDPREDFLKEEECSRAVQKCIIQQVVLGQIVNEGYDSLLAENALYKDLDMLRPNDANSFYTYLTPSQ